MPWQREIGWQRLDERGQERAVFLCEDEQCMLAGAGGIAINGSGLVYEYRVELDSGWQVQRAGIIAHLGEQEFQVVLERRGEGVWALDGKPAADLAGCTDIDFEFSACTNTLALKRLSLSIGEEADILAAWVTEPELKIQVLPQHYLRLDEHHYQYRSQDFSAVLEVDGDNIVIDYPGLFVPVMQTSAG